MMIPVEVPSILFVCTANIIRSPMAAGLLKQKLQRSLSFGKWKVESAGIKGLVGQPAEPKAQVVMETYGGDISLHVARSINRALISIYDLVLTVERQQRDLLKLSFPEIAEKIFFLGDLAGEEQDISDPVSGPVEDYFSTWRALDEILDKGLVPLILLAMSNVMRKDFQGVDGIPKSGDLTFQDLLLKSVSEDPVSIGLGYSKGFTDEFRYELLQLLMRLYPQDERPIPELQKLAKLQPPSAEEWQFLKTIRFYAIITPVTCLEKIDELAFLHPQIQSELDQLRSILKVPKYQELFKELELLYQKNLSPDKYRLGIWEFVSKYKSLPYKVGDYEHAYTSIREELMKKR